MDKCPLYKDLHNETDICRRQTALTRIDDRIRRVDAVEKARGEAVYLCDVKMEGMLNARFVRSTIARGTIDSIEVPQLPDGYWFISARDIPEGGRNSLVMIAGDWRCFADGDVRYVGETIGILVGPSPAVLKALEKEIRITYTEREPAITIDDAIAVKGNAIGVKSANFPQPFCCKVPFGTGFSQSLPKKRGKTWYIVNLLFTILSI